MLNEDLTLVATKDGEQIALWTITDDKGTADAQPQNIFLTHGTFSDKRVCLRIAQYLAELGHTCYIMEWRGHGASSAPKRKFNFETVATYDYEAVFRYLFDERQLDNLHTVTHSGGGVGMAMFLVQNPHYIDKVNSMTTFACQAYGAVLSPIGYAKILAAKVLTRLSGYIPAKRLGLGPVNESYYTMTQWYDWNLNSHFRSSFLKNGDIYNHPKNKRRKIKPPKSKSPNNDAAINEVSRNKNARFDYRQRMPSITTPLYAISGRGDRFISPTRGCRLFFDDHQNTDNVFVEYARANGHLEDYDHTRVLMSRNASTEIWPTVAAWIAAHAK